MAGKSSAKSSPRKSAKTSSAKLSDAVSSMKDAAGKAERAAGDTRDAMETSMSALGEGAAEFNRRCIEFAKSNIQASFDLATALAAARTPAEAMQLQTDFMRKQFEAMTSQSRELAELVGAVGRGAGNPFADMMGKMNWPYMPTGRK